jgi:hypothetical protein
MRLAATLAVLLFAIVPAAAADSIADQAQDAYATFSGGLSQRDFLSTQFGGVALQGIAGKWARLDGPDEKSGIESYGAQTDKTCAGTLALELNAPSPVEFLVKTARPANNLTFDYVLIAGSTFSEHTDIAPYLTSLALGPDNRNATDGQRALALSFVNGLVQVYRPSPDILVMTRDRGYPVVMARCPAN